MQTLLSQKACIGDYPWAGATEMKMNICILQPDNRINSSEYLKKQKENTLWESARHETNKKIRRPNCNVITTLHQLYLLDTYESTKYG